MKETKLLLTTMGDNPANKSINIIVPILRTPISDKSVAKKRRSLVF